MLAQLWLISARFKIDEMEALPAQLTPLLPDGHIELSIVIPCLNEAATIGRCIEKAKAFLDAHGVIGEIVVGDNGSTDGSQAIAQQLGARVIPAKLRGYGAAIAAACGQARGRYIIMGDADDSYDFSKLEHFLTELRKGYDLVMGNRFAGGIEPGAMPWKNRYIGNPVLTGIGRLFFRSAARDFHCGLRGFAKAAFEAMDLRTTGMEFASEMVIKATLMQLRVAEVPTRLHRDGRSRPPHLRPWHDGWRHLRFMLMYSPRWLFVYPGVTLIVLAMLGYAIGLPGLEISGVQFGVHTLIVATLAAILGIQSLAFAIFTKVFAVTEGLLPRDAGLERLFDFITLETGLIAGALFFCGGMGLIACAFYHWAAHRFGPLDYNWAMRLVIPGVGLAAVGFQVFLSSFFLSILGLKRR